MKYNVEVHVNGRWNLLAENISNAEVIALKSAHPHWHYRVTTQWK